MISANLKIEDYCVTFLRVIKTSVQKLWRIRMGAHTECVYIYRDLITDPRHSLQNGFLVR